VLRDFAIQAIGFAIMVLFPLWLLVFGWSWPKFLIPPGLRKEP